MQMRAHLLGAVAAAAALAVAHADSGGSGFGLGRLSSGLRSRGGASIPAQLPADLKRDIDADHKSTIAGTDYWTCAKAPRSKPKLKDYGFESYGVANWTLPDHHDALGGNDGTIHVPTVPVITPAECAEVVKTAEAYFAERGGWTNLTSGRFQIAGFWIKDVPPVLAWFNKMLEERLFPTVKALFPNFVDEISDLIVESTYMFKYTPETGKRSDIHTDSGCLSFTMALNGEDEFSGGGTWFEGLTNPDGTPHKSGIVKMPVGGVTFRPGGVRHQGYAVTRGKRYVIGGFMMHKTKVEYVRLLLNKGTILTHAGDFAAAERYFKAAVGLNENFDGAYTLLSNAQKRLGKMDDAEASLRRCLEVNPKNAEGMFSLGVLLAERGSVEEAERVYKATLELDPEDCDCMYNLAKLFGDQQRFEEETDLYKVLLATDPTHSMAAHAFCNLGVAVGELGELEDEIKYYRKALELDPEHYHAKFSLGSALASRKEWDESTAIFKSIVDADPKDDNALKNLYRVVSMRLREDPRSAKASPKQLTKRLEDAMGSANFAKLRTIAQR
uniref:Fe2OG dioxygenase domain-containing protein n=1 Tax=Phaeomonas parva TaxID=124430 RepID=A0A7S1U1D2_9STRA|mmetsp:Transcript_25144/g.78911  ORF Transcript_25144/g.78911 Transcript_25144/m.78911 type:complete len:556 (+) Transcript_25144:68-1735(+)